MRYKGQQTSGLTGNVNIILADREVVYVSNQGLSFPIVCTSLIEDPLNGTTEPNGNWEVVPELIGKSCNIEITVYNIDGSNEILTYNAIYGKPTQIQLPSKYSGFDSAGKGPITYLSIYALIKDNDKDLIAQIAYESELDPNVLIKLFMGMPFR